MSQALIARWDGFLGQIRERFLSLMTEARDGCAALASREDFNPIVMANAWTGIDFRSKELATKVADTWQSSVEPKFEEAGVTPAVIAEQRLKADALREYLEVERERNMVQIYVNAANQMFERDKVSRGALACSHCGGNLEVPWVFRAVHVTCPYCRAVSLFEPGTHLRTAEAMAIHPMCQARAFNEWVGMRDAEKAWHAARPKTLSVLRDWERSQIAYYTRYVEAKMDLSPDTIKDKAEEIRGRMRMFYFAVENEAVWAAAGRPRLVQ